MTVFRRLLTLFPESIPSEDFFTEIVAHLFSTNPDLLLVWLEQLRILEHQSYADVRVITQQTLEALAHHELSSRFDLLIELDDGTQVDWIVIESKLGSSEGPSQLRRYAEHLASNPTIRRGVLIFIMRDYEPKDRDTILRELPAHRVTFLQLRWNDFYHFLRKQSAGDLGNEITGFIYGFAKSG